MLTMEQYMCGLHEVGGVLSCSHRLFWQGFKQRSSGWCFDPCLFVFVSLISFGCLFVWGFSGFSLFWCCRLVSLVVYVGEWTKPICGYRSLRRVACLNALFQRGPSSAMRIVVLVLIISTGEAVTGRCTMVKCLNTLTHYLSKKADSEGNCVIT